ncbi:MAG: PKD domain-containing protein, partial [Vicinamibacteria bacterium]
PNTCKNVTVSTVPSTAVAPNGAIDFDSDSVNDLQVIATGACGSIPNALDPLGAVQWTAVSQDYRTVGIGDVGTPSSASTFCHPVADLFETGVVESSNGSIVKFWTPQNTGGSGVRFEFQILLNPVDPPDSDFTFTTYDLLAFFTDTSANDAASSWSWDFDDGQMSASQNPLHAFASADTYNVCLTASNVGGAGPTTCKDVTVSTVPSTAVAPGGFIDFDSDSVNDLQILAIGACGAIPNLLRPLGSTTWGSVSKDYRTVILSDAPAIASTSDFCHPAADLFSTGFVKTPGAIVKFWTPENTGSGVRFEFEVLSVIGDPLTFFTVNPCRLIDTRGADGPALAALSDRVFTAAPSCNIPSSAKAISVNIAVTGATAAGHLRFHPGGTAVPAVSTINYASGQTRSTNAVVSLNSSGELAVYVGQAGGLVHLIVDVNGYFE